MVETRNTLELLLEKYPNKPWGWDGISRNPNITMEFIEKYPNKPWDWGGISMNPNITMEIFEKNPNKPWDWSRISRNPNITMEFIEKKLDKINFKSLSGNKFTLQNKLLNESCNNDLDILIEKVSKIVGDLIDENNDLKSKLEIVKKAISQ